MFRVSSDYVRPNIQTKQKFVLLLRFQQELDPKRYGLTENDKVDFKGIINNGAQQGTIKDALAFLNDVYGKHISTEFLHLEVST